MCSRASQASMLHDRSGENHRAVRRRPKFGRWERNLSRRQFLRKRRGPSRDCSHHKNRKAVPTTIELVRGHAQTEFHISVETLRPTSRYDGNITRAFRKMTICSSSGYFPDSARFRVSFLQRTLRLATIFRVGCFIQDTASFVLLGPLAFATWPCGSRNLNDDSSYAKINLELCCNATKRIRTNSVDGWVVWGECCADPEAAASGGDTTGRR